MLNLKTFLMASIIFCLAATSCSNSDDNANPQTSTVTSTDTAPLAAPESGAAISTTTIYDMWVLDSINGKAPDSGYFTMGSPYFEIKAENNTISGFTGCNGISGKIKVADQRVTFDSLQVSSQNCAGKGKDFERKLLTGFRSGKTIYSIQNEKLHLDVGGGSNFIFRKIRR